PAPGTDGAPAAPSETRPQDAMGTRPNPFDDDADQAMGEADRFGEAEVVPSPDPVDGGDDNDFLQRDDASSMSCNEKRNRIRPRPLRELSLDVSPAFGEGLRAVREDTDEQRLEFAANARIRDWYDYRNSFVTTGRLVDLRDDRIVLDVNGVERKIALQDLSDVDLAYVGEAWNIPLSCGTGNETFTGRNFVHSTVQWKAPGHCHKPLYFEQTQLERYGHEAGPVVQPFISTAHFFANIAVLPYKMGIHPPNECQYSLGYYRPGNCAPYMVQPLPLSLRGAAAQAGFVTGAGALIP
ncbi:MAG: SHD1 domain-containing protein, partial [Planctomycetota bacterium]